MSAPQLLEGEDVATALRECDDGTILTIFTSAISSFLLGAEAVEVTLGSRSGAGDVTMRAQPSLFVVAILTEFLLRELDGALDAALAWREIVDGANAW